MAPSNGTTLLKLHRHGPQKAKTNFCGITTKYRLPNHSTLECNRQLPKKLLVTLQHTALAPCNGTTYPSKAGFTFPCPHQKVASEPSSLALVSHRCCQHPVHFLAHENSKKQQLFLSLTRYCQALKCSCRAESSCAGARTRKNSSPLH